MDDNVRITGEGEISYQLLDFSIKHNGFISSSILYVQRPGISDKLVYHYLIPRALNINRATIIFILNQLEYLPIHPQPDPLFESFFEHPIQLQPSRMYKIHAPNSEKSAEIISKLRFSLYPRPKESPPLIFIIDTSIKWTTSQENVLRQIIREAPLLNLSVWLHCPLHLIPFDLISSIGNVAIIWPSKSEIEILKNLLPNDKFCGPEVPLLHGMLFFSSLLCSDKGWEFTELGSPD
jgi:hypothetical protein